jgi:hypothetical protein
MTLQFELTPVDDDILVTDNELEIFCKLFERDLDDAYHRIEGLSDLLVICDIALHLHWQKFMPTDDDPILSFKRDCPNLDELFSDLLYFYIEGECIAEAWEQQIRERVSQEGKCI